MEKDYCEPVLKLASDTERAKILIRLVNTGRIDLAVVNDELDRLREEIEERANAVSEADEKQLTSEQQQILIMKVKSRYEANMHRHEDLAWAKVLAKLEANPQKLWSLNEMERTGGEPDVIKYNKKTGEITFFDCSHETPKGRHHVCYDRSGQYEAMRRGGRPRPKGNAVDMAAEMGIKLLNKAEYMYLQSLGSCDWRTGSWIEMSGKKGKYGLVGGFSLQHKLSVDRSPSQNHSIYCGFRGSLTF